MREQHLKERMSAVLEAFQKFQVPYDETTYQTLAELAYEMRVVRGYEPHSHPESMAEIRERF